MEATIGSERLPSFLRQTWLVFGKDVEIELRSGEVTLTSAFFALLVVVLSSLSFYGGPETSGLVASGAIWLSISFAAVLSLGRSWQRERDEAAIDGMLVAPIRRTAIFLGKALGVVLFLFLVELVVIPLAMLMFALEPTKVGLGLVAIALVATPGIAASGTLFGAMTVRTRARDLILAVVLFPLLSPTLLTAVVATRELFAGTPLTELGDYFQLMAVFDVVFVAGGFGLFGTLIDR
jgi:heme exporter protein B